MSDMNVVEAGPFAEWLTAMRAVLRGERDADVPCGECVGCCVSSYPIPLRPSDHVALDKVPARHLHLPSEPGGLARMGHGQDGHCPMLCAGKCSIYADRPRTCRDYDCRIYAAAGLLPDGVRPVIQERVLAWRFDPGSADDEAAAEAIRAAAQFIRRHADAFPPAMRAGSATAAAVLAVKTYEVFAGASDRAAAQEGTGQTIERVMATAHAFDLAAAK
jgi:hypothetical protein